jgi:hypothetical protein
MFKKVDRFLNLNHLSSGLLNHSGPRERLEAEGGECCQLRDPQANKE